MDDNEGGNDDDEEDDENSCTAFTITKHGQTVQISMQLDYQIIRKIWGLNKRLILEAETSDQQGFGKRGRLTSLGYPK